MTAKNQGPLIDESEDLPIQLQRHHIRMMGGNHKSAIVLSYLMNQFWRHKSNSIYKTDAEIKEWACLSNREFRNAKNRIREKNFIRIEVRGDRHVTHYDLDLEAYREEKRRHEIGSGGPEGDWLKEPAQRASGDWLKEPTRRPGTYSINNITSSHPERDGTVCAPSSSKARPRTTDFKNKRHPLWLELSKRLASAIGKAHKVNKTSKVESWRVPLCRIHKVDGVEVQRLRKVLEWYCKEFPDRWRDQYFPKVESGETFREKFLRVEDAMRRDARDESLANGEDPDQPRETIVPIPESRIVGTIRVRKGQLPNIEVE